MTFLISSSHKIVGIYFHYSLQSCSKMKSLSSVIECAETELSKSKKDKTLIFSFNSQFCFLKEKVFLTAICYGMVQQMQFLVQFSSVPQVSIAANCDVQHLCRTLSANRRNDICILFD